MFGLFSWLCTLLAWVRGDWEGSSATRLHTIQWFLYLEYVASCWNLLYSCCVLLLMGLFGGQLGRKRKQFARVKSRCWRKATQHWRITITVNSSGDVLLVKSLSFNQLALYNHNNTSAQKQAKLSTLFPPYCSCACHLPLSE